MARKHSRKTRRNRKAARHANPRRASRRSRRGAFSLFNARRHRNPALEGLATSLLAGGAGYVIAKGIGVLSDQYLPASVPQRALIGTGISAVAAVWVGETVLKNRPKISAAVQVGAMIPLAEELIKMTPLGPMIGLYETAPDAPSGGPAMLPAPGGMGANLAAALSSNFGDGDAWAPADY